MSDGKRGTQKKSAMKGSKDKYDGGSVNPGLRCASKENPGGMKSAPEKGAKSSGGTRMW